MGILHVKLVSLRPENVSHVASFASTFISFHSRPLLPQVVTPNMFNMELWNISGHAANYRDNMFLFEVGLRPHLKVETVLNLQWCSLRFRA